MRISGSVWFLEVWYVRDSVLMENPLKITHFLSCYLLRFKVLFWLLGGSIKMSNNPPKTKKLLHVGLMLRSSNSFKLVKNGSNWTRLVQTHPTLSKTIQTAPNLFNSPTFTNYLAFEGLLEEQT